MNYDLLHIQGKPFVLVPLHDYRDLSGESKHKDLPSDILDALAARQESPLKILRKYFGLTQEELAIRSGVSRPYIAEIETGKKDGSLRALKTLAETLNIKVGLLA
jgi:DNA-binding XRE family transcriptional regulator